MVHTHDNRSQTMQKSVSLMPQAPSCPFFFSSEKTRITSFFFVCILQERAYAYKNIL